MTTTIETIGPVMSPFIGDWPEGVYDRALVFNRKNAAEAFAVQIGWRKRDVYRIKAGSRNMPFIQWIVRDPCGMVITEAAYTSARA